jgi:acyl-CoA thioesterase
VPPSWAQGRASFGGLVAAIAVRPMLALVAPERWLRSVSVTFVGPLASAPAECHTQVLREGKALTSIESRITQDGTVRCIAIATFASDRNVAVTIAPPPPPVREPGMVVPFTAGLMPTFLQHYAMRWDSREAKDAHIVGACRYPAQERVADVCDVLALLDVWPPALVTMMKSFSAGSTASWTVDFVSRELQGVTSSWWSYEVHAVAASGGYGQTQAWLWDPEGRAVARSTQLVAVYE